MMAEAVVVCGASKSWRTFVVLVVVAVVLMVPAFAEVFQDKDAPGEQQAEKPIKIRFDPYMELCKGEFERPTAYTSLLYCWLDVRNAYSTLAPTKVELVNFDPFIALLHGVVHDGEIEQLQRLGDQHIKQTGPTNDSWLPVFQENHQTYTLHDRDHAVVETISRRVQQLSGLSVETAEDLKVIYNEVGSYKTSDIDVLKTDDEKKLFAYAGERLATVLFFLSDVENSGRTTFPSLHVGILPTKGTAAIWYNMKDTGEPDSRVKYSICPLMEDRKWTAKKILHTRGNEFRNPCLPRQSATNSP